MRRFFVGAPLFIYSTPPFKIHPIAMQSHSRQFIGFIFFSWLIRKWQQFLFVYIPKHCYFLWIIIPWQYYGKKNYSLHHSENQIISISRHQMIFPKSCIFTKNRLWHRCFPVNFENFLHHFNRTPMGDCFWYVFNQKSEKGNL